MFGVLCISSGNVLSYNKVNSVNYVKYKNNKNTQINDSAY